MLQKSIKKRYSNTKAHLRRKAGKSHLLAKKSSARKRRLSRKVKMILW
uniref:50S ribosomal protein L35 n=2 Tax=Cyanidioschyzon merolae TaxID=45157 RepID=Q85FX5_CYAM1|nr:ribosomal protein L35 [Cyanidioschyzon merolae strain 10D]QFV17007.1 50S ribosomal protein L35 [Cyanidioschyzon merolae]QFV17183.1 50S ribosomal protein L35 [Cyanidioschyzon merolae]BAC76218.1 50S ribosomal protein L35 [Cyanidioschyzon merolae strain 10D]